MICYDGFDDDDDSFIHSFIRLLDRHVHRSARLDTAQRRVAYPNLAEVENN